MDKKIRLQCPVTELIAFCAGLYKFNEPGVLPSEYCFTLLFRHKRQKCVRAYLKALNVTQYRRWIRALKWLQTRLVRSLTPPLSREHNLRWSHQLLVNWNIHHWIGPPEDDLQRHAPHPCYSPSRPAESKFSNHHHSHHDQYSGSNVSSSSTSPTHAHTHSPRHVKFAKDLLLGVYLRVYKSSSRRNKEKLRFVYMDQALTTLYVSKSPLR